MTMPSNTSSTCRSTHPSGACPSWSACRGGAPVTDCRKRLGSEGVIPDSTSIQGFEELLEYEDGPPRGRDNVAVSNHQEQ